MGWLDTYISIEITVYFFTKSQHRFPQVFYCIIFPPKHDLRKKSQLTYSLNGPQTKEMPFYAETPNTPSPSRQISIVMASHKGHGSSPRRCVLLFCSRLRTTHANFLNIVFIFILILYIFFILSFNNFVMLSYKLFGN